MDLAQCLEREVEPLLAEGWQGPPPSARTAALALISAARAHRVFQNGILPIAARLVARDLSALSARTQKDRGFR